MKQFILTNRNEIEIINLDKTREMLDRALSFLGEKVRAGGSALFVATQPQAAEAVLGLASEFQFPSVTLRWLGGTLTNFKIISKRIEYFKKLHSDFVHGAFAEKYTKKEQLGFERELARLRELIGGLENLVALPDVLVVIDPNMHATAIRETKRLSIPVIALISTDGDPDAIGYPVPGNNKARTSIYWFLSKVRGTIEEAKRLGPPAKPEERASEAPPEAAERNGEK